MKTIILAVLALIATPAVAQEATVRVHTIDQAFTGKVKDADVEPAYNGTLGTIDQNQAPWVAVTPGKWSREAAPEDRKNEWRLTAQADYDGDGTPDTAKLYTNGRQMAVIVRFAGGKAPMVIYKTDEPTPGTEIIGKGNRFVLNVPEVGYQVLLMHKGKPGVTYIGD